jgi:ribosomal protein S18 acetylase RimI-like enzyme
MALQLVRVQQTFVYQLCVMGKIIVNEHMYWVRKLRNDDLPCLHRFFSRLGSELKEDPEQYAQKLLANLYFPGAFDKYLVVTDETESIIAYSYWSVANDISKVDIHGIVLPSYWNQGVGNFLFQELEDNIICDYLHGDGKVTENCLVIYLSRRVHQNQTELLHLLIKRGYASRRQTLGLCRTLVATDNADPPSLAFAILEILDVDALHQVFEFENRVFNEFSWFVKREFPIWRSSRGQDTNLWIVIKTGEEIIGICICQRDEFIPQRGQILVLAIDSSLRRTGLGSQLLRIAERKCIDAGIEKLCLNVDVENYQALAFYTQNGFGTCNVWNIMEKTLDLRGRYKLSLGSRCL